MIRITLAVTGALAALAFPAATARACNGVTACPDLPTPIDFNHNDIGVYEIYNSDR
jgi:hypothetical protein